MYYTYLQAVQKFSNTVKMLDIYIHVNLYTCMPGGEGLSHREPGVCLLLTSPI